MLEKNVPEKDARFKENELRMMPDYHDEHCAFDSKPIKHTQWVRFLGKD